MKAFAKSPCQHLGVSPDGSAFPCLNEGWGDRACPAEAACGAWMKERQVQMYAFGYPYAAWVVRKNMLGLGECTLQFVRDAPTKENAEELFGSGVVRVKRAF